MRASFVIGGVVVAVLAIIGFQYWNARSSTDENEVVSQVQEGNKEPEQSTPEREIVIPEIQPEPLVTLPPETAPDNVEVPVIELPNLTASDAFVRDQLSQWAVPQEWQERQDLVSRMAVIVQNAASGKVPKSQLGFMAPVGKFVVFKQGEQLYVDPRSYQRYDRYVDLLEDVPADELASWLNLIEPLLSEGLALLGDRRPPRDRVLEAVQQVLDLPVLPTEVALLRPNVLYTYADPALERRSEFDKQLLRSGPKNISRIKAYVSEFIQKY